MFKIYGATNISQGGWPLGISVHQIAMWRHSRTVVHLISAFSNSYRAINFNLIITRWKLWSWSCVMFEWLRCLFTIFICLFAVSGVNFFERVEHGLTHVSTSMARKKKMDSHKYCRVIHAVVSQLMSTTESFFLSISLHSPVPQTTHQWIKKIMTGKSFDSGRKQRIHSEAPPHRTLYSDAYLNFHVSMAH